MKNYKILSVGGSIIIPKTGFDIKFLKKFRKLILDRVKKGEKFVMVVGGGATCRAYQQAAEQVAGLKNFDLEMLGIQSTIFNAYFVKLLFKGYVNEEIIVNPTLQLRSGQAKKPIIIGAGWKPGFSTDTDAVLLAKQFGAKEVINLSNIEFVYDKDPKKFKDAKKIEQIDWKTYRNKIVNYAWKAGKNAPFDPIASREAEKLGLTVKILRGTDLGEVNKALDGKKFKGTIIE